MRNRPNHRRSDHSIAGLSVALLALAGGLAAAAPARGDRLPNPLELHRAVHDSARHLLRDLVRVPATIHRAHEQHLRVFLSGTVFEPRHRHSHGVYRFPVWVDGSVVYRPFTYCGDRLYGAGPRQPLLWNDWGTGRTARWCDRCHASYPQRHAHFQAPTRDWNPRYDDSRSRWREHEWNHHQRHDFDRSDRRDRDRRDGDRRDRRGRDNHGRGHD